MQICIGKKKELPIEYEKYAFISEDFKSTFYKINDFIGDNYFRTEQGSFLFDDSKAKILARIVKKDKIIIRLLCIYDIDEHEKQKNGTDSQ